MPTKYLPIDDLALHYVHTGPTTLPDRPPELGRGAFLLFLHGEGGSAPLWASQLAHFAEKHSAVALDLPGHGRSAGLEGPASVEGAARLVARFLDGVQAPPAVVVGHGFSGHVALELARLRPERVRAVVAVATALRAPVPDDAIEKLRLVVRGRIGQQFDTPYFGTSLDPGVMRTFWTEMVKTDPKVRLGDFLAYRASTTGARLGDVEQPVLVIAGEADKLCARRGCEELAAALPRARLVPIPDAGHVPHLERPADVSRAIEELVAGL